MLVEEIVTDADGRYIKLKVLLKGKQGISVRVNTYGPNRDNKLVIIIQYFKVKRRMISRNSPYD